MVVLTSGKRNHNIWHVARVFSNVMHKKLLDLFLLLYDDRLEIHGSLTVTTCILPLIIIVFLHVKNFKEKLTSVLYKLFECSVKLCIALSGYKSITINILLASYKTYLIDQSETSTDN